MQGGEDIDSEMSGGRHEPEAPRPRGPEATASNPSFDVLLCRRGRRPPRAEVRTARVLEQTGEPLVLEGWHHTHSARGTQQHRDAWSRVAHPEWWDEAHEHGTPYDGAHHKEASPCCLGLVLCFLSAWFWARGDMCFAVRCGYRGARSLRSCLGGCAVGLLLRGKRVRSSGRDWRRRLLL